MTLAASPDSFLFVEKYRPNNIDDIIISQKVKDECLSYIKDGQIPNMLLSGGAGIGKTTLAKALARQIGADLLYINASNENGVDTIRTKIMQFASTASFEGNLKVVLLDEADGLTEAAQKILRAAQEEFHENTRFILTCNYRNRIIDALHSRSVEVDFTMTKEEKQELSAKAFKRVLAILKAEAVTYDTKVVAALVQRYFPDMRRLLNAIQKASAGGSIDSSSLSDSVPLDELFKLMKEKKFGDVRKWVSNNAGDHQTVFRGFYDRLLELFSGPSIPQIVILIDMYQERATRTPDHEITLMACLTEIMATANWA